MRTVLRTVVVAQSIAFWKELHRGPEFESSAKKAVKKIICQNHLGVK